MASINALEQQNKARTLSRPSVLTLDNFGASISRLETFYVNSTGQYVSNLFNVSTGLSLQVIPHVTIEKNKERIYLQVQIEDGNLGGRQVSAIPTVQQSSLTTQAMVKRDQSLLIGGLFLKVDKKQASGYPWLQRVPVLGYLFSVKGRMDDMVERIFVITPRIVEVDSKNLGDYSKYFQPAPLQQEALDEEAAFNLPVEEVPVPSPTPAAKKKK
jgi:type III secretion protein C